MLRTRSHRTTARTTRRTARRTTSAHAVALPLLATALLAAGTVALAGPASGQGSTEAASATAAVFGRNATGEHAGHEGHRADGTHSRAGNGADLAAARKRFARFADVEVALAEGYVPASPCETSDAGGMGVHYTNLDLVGSTDPSAPTVVLYEPTADGGARLLGVEWLSVDADQDLDTDEDRPSLFGRGFDGPMLGHAPGMPIHYDMHVWLYETNPDGVFAPWNPRVDCAG
ncbi:hypothetical protein [Aquipuribacter sp. SD81]|uniref:hypothetical protein n=1 Tax=Aquipuribacter sp. SD81 TaxID=3127703 RepID=UPI0030191B2E